MHKTNILPILKYGPYWRPIATSLELPTKCMKFQGSPNDAVVNITKMAIRTGEIVTRFQTTYFSLEKEK